MKALRSWSGQQFQQLHSVLSCSNFTAFEKPARFGLRLRIAQTTRTFYGALFKIFLSLIKFSLGCLCSKFLIRRYASQGQALRVLKKKSPHLAIARVVFFFQKPCPAYLLYQERLLNKKPEMAPAER